MELMLFISLTNMYSSKISVSLPYWEASERTDVSKRSPTRFTNPLLNFHCAGLSLGKHI